MFHPIELHFGTGHFLIGQYTGEDGHRGLIIQPVEVPGVIGAFADDEPGPHEPKFGEVYLHFSKVMIDQLEVLKEKLLMEPQGA